TSSKRDWSSDVCSSDLSALDLDRLLELLLEPPGGNSRLRRLSPSPCADRPARPHRPRRRDSPLPSAVRDLDALSHLSGPEHPKRSEERRVGNDARTSRK